MATAKKIIRALSGKNLTYVNAEKIAKDLGYSIVFFNTSLGDIEIERYNLQHKTNSKAFTYSKAAKIIFIDGTLHSDDRLYLLLHEIGHIVLGHVGDGKLMTRNQILIEFEADNFAYKIVYGEKKGYLYVLISAIVLSLSLLYSPEPKFEIIRSTDNIVSGPTAIEGITPSPDIPAYAETDVVYVTPHGTKYHIAGCRYLKNKTSLTELPRSEASTKYAPCKVCKP